MNQLLYEPQIYRSLKTNICLWCHTIHYDLFLLQLIHYKLHMLDRHIFRFKNIHQLMYWYRLLIIILKIQLNLKVHRVVFDRGQVKIWYLFALLLSLVDKHNLTQVQS